VVGTTGQKRRKTLPTFKVIKYLLKKKKTTMDLSSGVWRDFHSRPTINLG
jgi:hypothetical protein